MGKHYTRVFDFWLYWYDIFEGGLWGVEGVKKTEIERERKENSDKGFMTSLFGFRSNVALGVTTGMIRTKIDCRAGLDAIKMAFRKISLANDSTGVLDEWFTKLFLQKKYLTKLQDGVEDSWSKKHTGRNISSSIREALTDGIGQPLIDLMHYLEFDHMRHCLPNDDASGLGGLPVDYVYIDGKPDLKNRTTKKLPTGELLNGTESYRMILSYFTTTDISPEKIYEEGKKQLDGFYSEVT